MISVTKTTKTQRYNVLARQLIDLRKAIITFFNYFKYNCSSIELIGKNNKDQARKKLKSLK